MRASPKVQPTIMLYGPAEMRTIFSPQQKYHQ